MWKNIEFPIIYSKEGNFFQDKFFYFNFYINLFDWSVFFSVSAESRWEELHPGGERPPALQEHSAVAYKDCLYVFGGELGFSAGIDTPLWCYVVKV